MKDQLLRRREGDKRKAFFALALVCVLWGTTWVASRQGVLHMPGLQLSGIRQTLAGLIFIIFFLIKGAPWPKGREWYTIGVLGFLNILCSNGLTTWGVQYITGGMGAIIGATFPLWMVVIGLLTSKDRIPVNAMKGFLLGFGGICVIFYDHLEDFLNPEFLFGISVSVTAAWTWALGTIFTKKEARDFNPYFSMGLQMFMAGVALLFTSYMSGQTISIADIPWQSWTAIVYLAIFGSVFAFICYLFALQNLPIEQVSIYAYINPIVAVLIGSSLFGEKISIFIVIGGAITLYGVYMINHALRKNGNRPH